MKPDLFKCAGCEEVFQKGWTDEDAVKEMNETVGEIPLESRVVLCSVCYVLVKYKILESKSFSA